MKRKRYGKEFKARVALEAIKGEKTANELVAEYEVHVSMINTWKKQALEGLPEVFGQGQQREAEAVEAERDRLYRQIGKLQVEVDWLKKRPDISTGVGRAAPGHRARSPGLERCPPVRAHWAVTGEDAENLELMRLIDEEYTRHRFYGSRKMVLWLRSRGHEVNRKRVQRLMGRMGLASVAPKPNTSRAAAQHKVYPYLLGHLAIARPNQVWCTDITYIRLARGFVYRTAVMDWHSR
jgi:putative transposase